MTNRGLVVITALLTAIICLGFKSWFGKYIPRIEVKINPKTKTEETKAIENAIRILETETHAVYWTDGIIQSNYIPMTQLPFTNGTVQVGFMDNGNVVWRLK